MHPDLAELQRQYAGSLGAPPTVVSEGLLMLAGAYTAISPWVIGFAATQYALTVNNLILGLVVAAIGLGITGTPERRGGISWTAVPIGAWLIAAEWVLHRGMLTAGVFWSNIVAGAVTIVLGLAVAGLVVVTRGRTG